MYNVYACLFFFTVIVYPRGRVCLQCPTMPSVAGQPAQSAPAPACIPLAYQALQVHAVPFEVPFSRRLVFFTPSSPPALV